MLQRGKNKIFPLQLHIDWFKENTTKYIPYIPRYLNDNTEISYTKNMYLPKTFNI